MASSSFSPLTRLQDELNSEVSSGTISSSDQNALSAALTDIDSSLKSDATSGGKPSRTDMQSKINDLISNEVTNGKLTSSQADELKQVFANAFKGGPGGPGGPGRPGDQDASAASTASSASDSSSSSSDITTLLTDFLNSLKSSNGSSSTYDTSGSSLASQIQSLVLNVQA